MTQIYLARNVLDHQLLDKNGRRCGKVDDLAIESGGETAQVTAILIGPGYWPQRSGWIGRLGSRVAGSKRTSVPWANVKRVNSAVELRNDATEYGLGSGDDRLRPLLEKIPGADR